MEKNFKKLDDLLESMNKIEDSKKGTIKGGFVDVTTNSSHSSHNLMKYLEMVSVTGTCGCSDDGTMVSVTGTCACS